MKVETFQEELQEVLMMWMLRKGGFPKFAKQDFNDNCICFEIMKIYGDRIGL